MFRNVLVVEKKNKICAFIKRDCEFLKENKINFCFECNTFPCQNLKRMDRKYTDRYGMSFVENLLYIKENGLNRFIQKQNKKYRCIQCGDTVCIHNKKCYTCDKLFFEKYKRC